MRSWCLVPRRQEQRSRSDALHRTLEAMGKFNEQLVKAGVMLAGEGLHPPRRARASSSRTERRSSSMDLSPNRRACRRRISDLEGRIRGRSRIEWIEKAPFKGSTMELRQIFEKWKVKAKRYAEIRRSGKPALRSESKNSTKSKRSRLCVP